MEIFVLRTNARITPLQRAPKGSRLWGRWAWEGRRRGMAQRSLRRDQENQLCDRRFQRVGLTWT